MKTDTIFYQLFKEFPNIFFELIGKPDTNLNTYEFTVLEIKEQGFRLDGLFSTLEEFSTEPIYFVEVQCYKDEEFYERLFAEIFLYFRQYKPANPSWYAIVIYDRRSNETPCHPRYGVLVENHLRRFYLNEIEPAADESLGTGILRLIVETPKNTSTRAQELINKARVELVDDIIQRQVLEFIETIVVYKFPNLGREEIEAMLGLDLLRQTRVYQEAKEEGIEQGIERGKLQTKLEMVPLLLELGLSIQEVSVRLQLDEETVRKAAEN
ncbi:Rpn family recombination-promoting nuclease/putative transposase [Argonema galeatum]|uniref:Rpn family recombination-promoting nuclease/putative transposase n=1 Tax=Argonema galeatum TaxID=2942762 RepID=UPI00201380D5|nr:Rpn family recombination-promoting nuclease/putative transposase [Argonema galeatum A003/A1]